MNPEYIYDAPMKIGRKLVGKNKVKGDCGYGIEESLFGGRVFCQAVNRKHGYPFTNSLRIEVNNDQSYLKDAYVQSTLNFLFPVVEIPADACKWKVDDISPTNVELVVKRSRSDDFYNPSDKDEIEDSDEDSSSVSEEEQCWKD